MMDVEQKIEMIAILQQSDMEKPVVVDVKRHNHLPLFCFNVGNVFYLESEGLAVIDSLLWVALFVQSDACEQGGVCCDGSLNCCLECFFIQTTVEYKEIRQIITNLTLMSNTFGIDAILHFS